MRCVPLSMKQLVASRLSGVRLSRGQAGLLDRRHLTAVLAGALPALATWPSAHPHMLAGRRAGAGALLGAAGGCDAVQHAGQPLVRQRGQVRVGPEVKWDIGCDW